MNINFKNTELNLGKNTSIIIKGDDIKYRYYDYIISYKLRSYNENIIKNIIESIINDDVVNHVYSINDDILLSIDNLRYNGYYEYLIINNKKLSKELKYDYNIFYIGNIYKNKNICIDINKYTDAEILNIIDNNESVILIKNLSYHLIHTIFKKEIIFNNKKEIINFLNIEYGDKIKFKMKWGDLMYNKIKHYL